MFCFSDFKSTSSVSPSLSVLTHFSASVSQIVSADRGDFGTPPKQRLTPRTPQGEGTVVTVHTEPCRLNLYLIEISGVPSNKLARTTSLSAQLSEGVAQG